jgi:hypothetical protein
MVTRETRGSAVIGIPLGLATAAVGWWAVSVSVALIGDAANTLAQPQYPAGPRLVLVGAVMATCAVAVWSRPAALAMAGVAAAFVAYSWLVFVEVGPAVLAPGAGAGAGGAVIRDAVRAIVTGGANVALLLAGGGWVGIALWWLIGRAGRPASAGRLVIGLALGILVGVVAWWAQPVVTRAMGIMFYEGRDAFSVLPSVLLVGLAAASALAILRWPAVGLGAATAAIGFVVFSLGVDDPASGVFAVAGNTDWWSVRLVDLEESVRSTAFRPATLVLAAGWAVMAAPHLIALRRDYRSRPVPQLTPTN